MIEKRRRREKRPEESQESIKTPEKLWIPDVEIQEFYDKREIIKSALGATFLTFSITLVLAYIVRGSLSGLVVELLMFSDKIFALGLLVGASAVISWPKEPIFSTHLLRRLEALQKEALAQSTSSTDGGVSTRFHSAGSEPVSLTSSEDTLSSIINHTLTGDVALLIHCPHGSVDPRTVLSALGVFPPDHIFVVRASCCAPAVAAAVVGHEDVRQVMVPFATTDKEEINEFMDKWLSDEPKFRYIMQVDSGSRLPGNLHIPKERLRTDTEINWVHFAVEVDEAGKLDQTWSRKISIFELLKDQLAAASFCFPEASLWRKSSRSGSVGAVATSLQTPIRMQKCETVNGWAINGELLWQVVDPNTFRRRKGLGIGKLFALYELVCQMLNYVRPLLYAVAVCGGWEGLGRALVWQMSLGLLEGLILETVLMRKRGDLRKKLWRVMVESPMLSFVYDVRYVAKYAGRDVVGRAKRRRFVCINK
jgi:hypothetical protein